ncbi:unnamed protein product, partial [Urochloa humidicola]
THHGAELELIEPAPRANHPYKTFGFATARASHSPTPPLPVAFLPCRRETHARNARAAGGRNRQAASMGNCQAAEAAAVLIQHPGGGRTERAYWALSAGSVMAANPGHYVAAVIATTQPAADAASGSAPVTVKHLKLLRPDDTLLLGRVYRLVSFEEVLREFSSKRHVKLSRVTVRAKDDDEEPKPKPKPAAKHRRRRATSGSHGTSERKQESDRSLAKVMRQVEEEPEPTDPSSSGASATKHGHHTDAAAAADLDAELEAALLPQGPLMLGRRGARQWKPALQSIAEG